MMTQSCSTFDLLHQAQTGSAKSRYLLKCRTNCAEPLQDNRYIYIPGIWPISYLHSLALAFASKTACFCWSSVPPACCGRASSENSSYSLHLLHRSSAALDDGPETCPLHMHVISPGPRSGCLCSCHVLMASLTTPIRMAGSPPS